MPVESVLMEMFVWWEAPISMKVEWRYASMISGEQCAMMVGAVLMQLWSARSWDMQSLEVSGIIVNFVKRIPSNLLLYLCYRWNSI